MLWSTDERDYDTTRRTNAAAKKHRHVYGADVNTFGGWGKAASGLPLRQCGRWSQRAHEHTSTRAHDTQPIPPQINLTIRGNTSPAAAQKYVTNTHQDVPPSRAAPQKTPHPTPPRPNRRPLHPNHPMSPASHQGGLHFEQALGGFYDHRPLHGHAALALPSNHGGFCDHRPPTRRRHAAKQRLWQQFPPSHQRKQATPPRQMDKDVEHDQHSHLKSTRHWPIQATTGGFATIDPRHADDTPQRSAYGSNSPQATNEDKPHNHEKWTRMSKTANTAT